MNRQSRKYWAPALLIAICFTGCGPMQPYYLKEDGDLSHYIDAANEIRYPDSNEQYLEEAVKSGQPLTTEMPIFESFWDLSLEEAVQTALHNSKVIRRVGAVSYSVTGNVIQPSTRLLDNPEIAQTVYNPAITESDPNFGVEGALAEFDAQLAASVFWEKTHRPQNTPFGGVFLPTILHEDAGTGTLAISKKSAVGTIWTARSESIYSKSNRGLGVTRALPSDWMQNLELEARHPLLRGSGTMVNRIPVMVARIREDISLADFEASVRDMVFDVESAYWELYFFYRQLEAAKAGLRSALGTWKKIEALRRVGGKGGEAEKEAQARRQYFEFRARLEEAQRDLFRTESRLRYLMGLAASDGRMVRPSTEPISAQTKFQWCEIQAEALVRSVNLRKQKWYIKQREMELIAARNDLLPQMDVVGLYRWLGMGDELIRANETNVAFPGAGSTAWEEMMTGKFGECRFGIEMTMPIGFRRELAGVRNVQLKMARDRAVLHDMELELVHALTDAVQVLDANYQLTQTNFARRVAAEKEVKAVQAAYDLGTQTLDVLLNSQQRLAESEVEYYRSLVNYNKAIIEVHFYKGSLLEFDNVYLAEGPWPAKAYFDALGHARRRDASHYLNYGFTRPGVISRGPYAQHEGKEGGPIDETILPTPDSLMQQGQPTVAEPRVQPELIETPVPTGPEEMIEIQTPVPAPHTARVIRQTSAVTPVSQKPIQAVVTAAATQPVKATPAKAPAAAPVANAFQWGNLGLQK